MTGVSCGGGRGREVGLTTTEYKGTTLPPTHSLPVSETPYLFTSPLHPKGLTPFILHCSQISCLSVCLSPLPFFFPQNPLILTAPVVAKSRPHGVCFLPGGKFCSSDRQEIAIFSLANWQYVPGLGVGNSHCFFILWIMCWPLHPEVHRPLVRLMPPVCWAAR